MINEQTKIEFFHACKPPRATAQQRQFFRNGKSALTPQAALAAATWQAIMELYRPVTPLIGPISVTIYVTWPGRGVAGYKTTKPDADNLSKLILDAMTKSGYWEDDAEVSSLEIVKYTGDMTGVYVLAGELEPTRQPRAAQRAKSSRRAAGRVTTRLSAENAINAPRGGSGAMEAEK